MDRDDVRFRVVELCELADKIFGTKLFGNVSVGFFSKGTAAGLPYHHSRGRPHRDVQGFPER